MSASGSLLNGLSGCAGRTDPRFPAAGELVPISDESSAAGKGLELALRARAEFVPASERNSSFSGAAADRGRAPRPAGRGVNRPDENAVQLAKRAATGELSV